MTAMKPVLDVVLDANVVFLVAFLVWGVAQSVIVRSRLKSDFHLQLRLLRTVLLVVILSPILSMGAVAVSRSLWPEAPITFGDLAVAAYLRGDIAIPALQFEAMLNARDSGVDRILAGDYPWLTALFGLIALGTIALLFRTLVTIVHVNRLVSQSFVWRRTRTTDLRLSDTATIPFAARGVFRKHIVLPSRLLLDPREMRIVLAHEFEHLRQGDVEWELAFELLRPFLYWNPVFVLWTRTFGKLRELSCDRAVLDTLRISPREYARCLLSFCGRPETVRPIERFNVAFVRTRTWGARRTLETRVLAMGERRHTDQNHTVFWGIVVTLSIAIIVAATSIRSPGDWSHDRLMLSTIVNLERLDAINRGY